MASRDPDTTTAARKDAEERPNKLRRTMGGGPSGLARVITVVVGTGDAQETFVLHESLLRQSSEFFNNVLKEEWKDSKDSRVCVSETISQDFAIYAKFLMTGLLFIKPDNDLASVEDVLPDGTRLIKAGNESKIYRRLNRLADFLQAPDFRDAVVDAYIDWTREVGHVCNIRLILNASSVNDIYKHSTRESPFRKFLVEQCLYGYNGPDCRTDFKKYNHDFCCDFIKATGVYVVTEQSAHDMLDPSEVSNICKYHEHTQRGDLCYKEKFQYLDNRRMATNGQETASSQSDK